MTTMFVQLRRVVYLLVLLQCCAYLARANDGQNTEENVVGAEKKLVEWMKREKELLGKGKGCVKVWKEEKESCVARSTPTKGAADAVVALLKKIKDKVGELVTSTGGVNGGKVRVEEVKETMQKTQETVNDTRATLDETTTVTNYCYHYLDYWKQEVEAKDDTRKYYISEIEGAKDEYKTPARIELVEESNKMHESLTWGMEELAAVHKWSYACAREVKEEMVRANRSMNEIEEVFDDHKEEVKGARIGTVTVAKKSTIKERLDVAWKEAALNIEKAKEEEKQKKKQAELEKAKAQRDREAEERRLQEQAQRERQAQVEKEKEQAQREREAEQRSVQEQAQRERQAQVEKEKEQAQREREAEQRRVQEQAQRERQTQVEKEKEQLERAAEEAKKKAEAAKKNDNSNSPAMVQSSMLFLVLCVLGCTLVC